MAARSVRAYLSRRADERAWTARQIAFLSRRAGIGFVAATVAVHLIAGLMPVVFLVGISFALRQLVTDGGLASGSGWLAAALGAFLAHQAVTPVQTLMSKEVARRVDDYCITRLTSSTVLDAPLVVLERPDVADLLSEVNEAFEQWTLTPGAATEGGLALTARYTQLVGAVTVLAVAVGPLAAMAAATVALVTRLGQTEAFHRWGQAIRALGPVQRRVAYVRQLATGTRAAKDIRVFGLTDWLDDRFAEENRELYTSMWSRRREVYGKPFVLYTLVALVGTAGALLVVALTARAPGQPANLVATVAMGIQAAALCARFGTVFPESDLKLVYGLNSWAAQLTVEDRVRAFGRLDTLERTAPGTINRCVHFSAIRYAYPGGHPVLNCLDLELVVGGSTAIVGANGAGKTTLVKLLMGLYEPDSGAVMADGVDLRTIDLSRWQRRFAVTFQDYIRYEMSLRDNVAMFAIEHRDDSGGITATLARVGLADLVETLPDGLDTPLSRSLPGGRDLSGGQWQRVALARSLFAVRHEASILILDEPTAHLDARGEAAFYDRFLDLTKGVTSLVISHRFSSVRRADRIVVLDQGRVAESGTHTELTALNGTYAKLFAIQARMFDDVPG